jgi:FkbM family methyltransferase
MIRTIIHQLGLNKIVVLRKLVDFVEGTLRSTTFPFPSRIQGFWIKGPPLMDIIQRVYEPETTNLVKRLIRPGFNFVDVGADYGYYSLLVAKVSHDQAHIYAFEPSINRFDQYLIPNIRRNHYRNIYAYKQALSDTNKPAAFYLEGGSLYNVKDEKQMQTVECDLLDNIIPKDVKIDLVKIDVEGAEINVLLGMERIMADSHHIKLIIEINPQVLARAGHTAREITDYLLARGFGMYCIEHDGSLSKFRNTAEMQTYAYARKYVNVLFQRNNV